MLIFTERKLAKFEFLAQAAMKAITNHFLADLILQYFVFKWLSKTQLLCIFCI